MARSLAAAQPARPSAPPAPHAPMAVQAWAAGRHEVVEKPRCLGLREADGSIASARRAGCALAVRPEAGRGTVTIVEGAFRAAERGESVEVVRG